MYVLHSLVEFGNFPRGIPLLARLPPLLDAGQSARSFGGRAGWLAWLRVLPAYASAKPTVVHVKNCPQNLELHCAHFTLKQFVLHY